MRTLPLLLLTTSIVFGGAFAHAAKPKASKDQCQRWNNQLEQVQNKLRRGYSTKQGNKLRERRRKLLDKVRHRCR